ncbi:MAG TPA: nuclear transport factor 2 family protein [Propionibacteriaceae bacterium]|nr:nuclear transport factor 2 family protein [Propionibacteriaceae bacterium]
MDAHAGVGLLDDGPVKRMITAANRHDLDAMLAEFSPDYENVTPIHPAQSFTGSAQVRRNWESLFAGIPDLRLTVHNATTAKDGTVWMEWSSVGTRRDGTPVEMAGVAIFTVGDDQIAGVHFYLEPVDHSARDVDAAVQGTTHLPPARVLAGGEPR